MFKNVILKQGFSPTSVSRSIKRSNFQDSSLAVKGLLNKLYFDKNLPLCIINTNEDHIKTKKILKFTKI